MQGGDRGFRVITGGMVGLKRERVGEINCARFFVLFLFAIVKLRACKKNTKRTIIEVYN